MPSFDMQELISYSWTAESQPLKDAIYHLLYVLMQFDQSYKKFTVEHAQDEDTRRSLQSAMENLKRQIDQVNQKMVKK